MLFCPFCGSLLLLSKTRNSAYAQKCPGCAYVAPIRRVTQKVTSFTHLNKVATDGDDFDDVESSKLNRGQTTAARCVDDACAGKEAQFWQVQMRSADEGATVFYRCTTCGTRWRHDG